MHIVIVGSLGGYVSTAAKIAKLKGAHVTHLQTTDSALIHLRAGRGGDLILVDLDLPIETFLKNLEQERINTEVIACGVDHEPEIVERAIKAGAKDYLPLPPDPELIAAVYEQASKEEKTFVFKDPLMLHWVNLAKKVAPSEATVLITGDSGTGKEVIARTIHENSKRASKPFICVNCAAIPEHLLESELFGHEKGAFTGAVAKRVGKFFEAHGGTLLLDEITEMPLQLQAKLLRAIQEKVIDPIGSQKPVKVDFRLIATSNRNMQEAVKEQLFREDLFFRLNVVNLKLPSLKDRPQDISALSDYFIDKFSKLNCVPLKPMSKEAKEVLRTYPWPGNVRELENTIHRAVLLSGGGEIEKADLFLEDLSPCDSKEHEVQDPLVGQTVSQVEKTLILSTLNHCLGNRTKAASLLGISIRTLRNKLKEYEESQLDPFNTLKLARG